VLFSDVHEQHYYDQMMLMSNLKAFLANMGTLDDGQRSGMIEKGVLYEGLREFFPAKNVVFLNELFTVAVRDACEYEEVSHTHRHTHTHTHTHTYTLTHTHTYTHIYTH
jgi:hypothetical protein